MTEKRVTVILYGSDRNLWRGGPLQIRVSDLFAAGGPKLLSQGKTDESTLELRLQLPFDAGQLYGLTFSAPRHRPAWQIRPAARFHPDPRPGRRRRPRPAADAGARFAGNDGRAGRARTAASRSRRRSRRPAPASTPPAFEPLDVAAKMAFLNIEAKLRETVIDGAPLISFVRGVRHVAVDRVFLLFDAALKARMPRAVDFAGAPGHDAPKEPAGLPGSSRQLEAHAVCRRERPAVVLGGRRAVSGGGPRRWCTRPTWTSISGAASRTRRSGSRTTSSGRATRPTRPWSTRCSTRRGFFRSTRWTRSPRRRVARRRGSRRAAGAAATARKRAAEGAGRKREVRKSRASRTARSA